MSKSIKYLEMYRADLEYQSKVKSINEINQDNDSCQWESLDELNDFIRDLSDEINRLKVAFDLIDEMDVQHEFEDFCVVHVPKDVMDEWSKVNGRSSDE